MRKYVVPALLAFLATLGVAAFLMTPTTRPAQESFTAYKKGVGVHARIPQSSGEVSSSVESACAFLFDRSGVSFSQSFKDRLVALETASLAASRPNLERTAEIISLQLLETASSVSDSEIDAMPAVWKASPDFTAENRSPLLSIAINILGPTAQDFPALAKEFRDGLTPASQQWRAEFPDLAFDQIKIRAELFANALPEQWGSGNYSPLQSVLLAYSLVTLDFLDGDIPYLAAHMQWKAGGLKSTYGIDAPSEGRKAFGVNGYLYSTPANILFTEQVVNRILDRYEEVLQ